MLQLPDELVMSLLRRTAFMRGLLRRDHTALGGPLLTVPHKRVGTREKVATLVAEVDHEGVRLREVTMSFELLKVLELLIRAETALDRLHGPTCKVAIRSLEEQSRSWLEFAGYLEKLVFHFLLVLLRRVVTMTRCFLINTPLVPSRLPIRSVHHPSPRGTWSRQGLMVNSLRTRGREPLCSASRRLGFPIDLLYGNPGHQLVVGPGSGLRSLQDSLGCSAGPGSLLGRNFVGMCPNQAPIVLRRRSLTVTFPEGHHGCECRCHI
jgi:hypothetical protein